VLKTVERLRTGAVFYPLDRRFLEDPYPQYRRLRERDPFHKSMLTGGWVLSRHRDISAVLRDPRCFVDNRKLPNWTRMRDEMVRSGAITEEEAESRMMLTSDPPDHTRLRSLVNRAFTPRAVESLRPRMEEIVEQQLGHAAAAGRMDVIADLASPLPVMVISEMLGIPTADREQFTRWSHEVAHGVGNVTMDEQRIATRGGRELRAYLATIVDERRREPREDLLSALVAAEQDGDKLTMDEVYSMAVLLLVAGNETTTNLIGNGLIALLRHPEQVHALRDHPSLIGSAIEELLRYDSPVQMTVRFTLEDVDLGEGQVLKAGKQTFLLLGAANRDPEAFERPDDLDITRQENRHLSFSNGIHYCLGAPLARMEGQIALSALVSRFPDMRLSTDRLEWSNNIVLRGVRSLPIVLA
jgi:pimeloyl-[acyl-carrier protein] synthase